MSEAPPPLRAGEAAPPSYQEWTERFDRLDGRGRADLESRLSALVDPPLISVVLPVYEPSERFLREAIDSVTRQVYPHWELCIVDDASPTPWVRPTLETCSHSDPRIKVHVRRENGRISAATNTALSSATGRFVGFLDHDDTLADTALALIALAVAEIPDAGMLYSDEDKIDADGRRSAPYFKPSWDPVLLLGQNYLAHFFVVRRDLLEKAGGLRSEFDGAQDWDLVLRISEQLRHEQIVHIPHVLYHWRLHPDSTASRQSAKPYAAVSALEATEEHFVRTATKARVTPLGKIGYQRTRWSPPADAPLVSIIIPTRDGRYLQRCLESLWYRTQYPRYEILVVDNGSRDLAILGHLADHADKLRLIRDGRPFNFSALNNSAATQARGDVFCLLNDDIEVLSGDWLDEMVSLLFQQSIGVVGAKLYFEDRTIQHAGLALGVGGIAAHCFRFFDPLFFGHAGHAILPRLCSAVTGACMVTRRQTWEDVDGFDESLAIAYNDVDYCLRCRSRGWRTAWTPFAELIHYESATRGADTEPANVAREELERRYMVERWGSWLQADPAYNPNLTFTSERYDLAWPPRVGPFAMRPSPTVSPSLQEWSTR